MPSRNRIKEYAADAYYHVYNRGVNKRRIFIDEEDYAVFLNLLKRYLDTMPTKDTKGREYEWLHEKIELLAYCLMPTHYHLFVYQHDPEAMTRLLRGVNTSYATYFNKKYKRVGPLFHERFKARMIDDDSYLLHISRYIHINPDEYLKWPYSSLMYYLGDRSPGWVQTERILRLFEKGEYLAFVRDYDEHNAALKQIKSQLADT